MPTPRPVRVVLGFFLLLCGVSFAGIARAAAYGAEVKEFFIQKFSVSPTFSVELSYSTNFFAPPLNAPGADVNLQVRLGTLLDSDINDGLRFKPGQRGETFCLGGHCANAQILELETALSGLGAIDSTPNSSFFMHAIYEHMPYMREGYISGIGLSNLLHQPANPEQRAFGVGVALYGGQHYVMSKNFLTGQVIQAEPIGFDHPYIELRMGRAGFDSNDVFMSAAFRDENFIPVGSVIPLGITLAFSDVVLRPAIFAAVPIPEPRTWALLLAGLTVIVCAVRRRGLARVGPRQLIE